MAGRVARPSVSPQLIMTDHIISRRVCKGPGADRPAWADKWVQPPVLAKPFKEDCGVTDPGTSYVHGQSVWTFPLLFLPVTHTPTRLGVNVEIPSHSLILCLLDPTLPPPSANLGP